MSTSIGNRFTQADAQLLIKQYKDTITQKVRSGEAEPAHMIGANAYTENEWDKLMKRMEDNVEIVKEEQQQRFEKRDKQEDQKEIYEKLRFSTELQKNLNLKEKIMSKIDGYGEFPYYYLAKDGVIEYNGVTFVADPETNSIMLGDCSEPKNCIRVPLEEGGSLVFNRDNIGDITRAISMFSPEDINRIMRAISLDAKKQQMHDEIEEHEHEVAQKIAEGKNNLE